jgi:hypothetical protein
MSTLQGDFASLRDHGYKSGVLNLLPLLLLPCCAVYCALGVEDVKARYTFIYRKIDDKWFIAEHHSSAMPEK